MATKSHGNTTKKKKNQPKDGPGIFKISVDGKFVDHLSALSRLDAEHKYKLAHPTETGKIEAKRVRGNLPGTGFDVDKQLKDMTRNKLALEEITNPPTKQQSQLPSTDTATQKTLDGSSEK
jgi:hypothetical protein